MGTNRSGADIHMSRRGERGRETETSQDMSAVGARAEENVASVTCFGDDKREEMQGSLKCNDV